MRISACVICVGALWVTGCHDGYSQTRLQPSAAEVKEQAEAYAKDWANMGMWLPDKKQVAFFVGNFDGTKDLLTSKLSDPNDDVRQRAAYVIEQLGPTAKPTEGALASALSKEKVPLVRVYLCNALRAVGSSDKEALAELRKLLRASGNDKDTLEQRIYAAAALSTLSNDPKESSECIDYVCQWLKAPDDKLSPAELEKYWDLRWSAVNAVADMKQAQQAIPLLEKMLNEPGKRAWVDVHVPTALAALKGTPAPQHISSPATHAAWTPPANPNPQAILNEAQADMIAGNYEQALAKHVWFYRNALKFDRALYGVRLSFALSYWKQLATVYPPAKTKLVAFRDEAANKVTSGENLRESFHDFESINSVLGDEKKTAELFTSLDKKNPKAATQVFNVARPALIRAGDIKLCSKYVDAKDYPRLVHMYQENLKIAADATFGEAQKDFARHSFSNDVATLVALLAVGDRKTEAEKIAADAKKVLNDKNFDEALQKALQGKVPEPWPPALN